MDGPAGHSIAEVLGRIWRGRESPGQGDARPDARPGARPLGGGYGTGFVLVFRHRCLSGHRWNPESVDDLPDTVGCDATRDRVSLGWARGPGTASYGVVLARKRYARAVAGRLPGNRSRDICPPLPGHVSRILMKTWLPLQP